MGPAAVRTASHLPASPRAPPLPLTVYGACWRRRPLSRFCPDMLLTPRPAAFLCHERRTFLGVIVPSPPVVGISRPIALPPLLNPRKRSLQIAFALDLFAGLTAIVILGLLICFSIGLLQFGLLNTKEGF